MSGPSDLQRCYTWHTAPWPPCLKKLPTTCGAGALNLTYATSELYRRLPWRANAPTSINPQKLEPMYYWIADLTVMLNLRSTLDIPIHDFCLPYVARELQPWRRAHRRGYDDPDVVLTSVGAKNCLFSTYAQCCASTSNLSSLDCASDCLGRSS